MMCIIGPNGSGKSTLLKTIFGIVTPRQGKVHFKGRDITGLNTWSKLEMGLVYIPQGRNIFPDMTVEENLELGAYIRKDKDLIKDDIAKVYERYPVLKERRKQTCWCLSGGEQQMLQLARGLLLHPSMLLVDEPTAGLAPKVTTQMFEQLVKLRDEGISIILIEHNAKKALSISDRALVLVQGQIAFEGTGQEILENRRVRETYLGG